MLPHLLATPRLKRLFLLLFAVLSGSLLFLFWALAPNALPVDPFLSVVQNHYGKATLGIASKIFVISLPSRALRREQMEKLRETLGLRWQYVDAIDSQNPFIGAIIDWIKHVRVGPPTVLNEAVFIDLESPPRNAINFTWPSDIDRLSASYEVLDFQSTDIWPAPSGIFSATPYHPIACATKNFNIVNYTYDLPEHRILTPSRVACWHSHLSVIHKIANDDLPGDEGVYIILEDDIDMERDIHLQLASLWSGLPHDWDIVFLGHCWSKEDHYAPIVLRYSSSMASTVNYSGLHPSRSPKCTHAYALSRSGARRLFQHLRYPPFAYSRAIDQAISWLVESGRLKSFSIVPSIVVQRKIEQSDIIPGKGAIWKDTLNDGVMVI